MPKFNKKFEKEVSSISAEKLPVARLQSGLNTDQGPQCSDLSCTYQHSQGHVRLFDCSSYCSCKHSKTKGLIIYKPPWCGSPRQLEEVTVALTF